MLNEDQIIQIFSKVEKLATNLNPTVKVLLLSVVRRVSKPWLKKFVEKNLGPKEIKNYVALGILENLETVLWSSRDDEDSAVYRVECVYPLVDEISGASLLYVDLKNTCGEVTTEAPSLSLFDFFIDYEPKATLKTKQAH